MAKTRPSTLIINTLGLHGSMPHADFSAKERAALRRLAKKGWVIRVGDSWATTTEGASHVDANGPMLGEVVTTAGREALIAAVATDNAKPKPKAPSKRQAVTPITDAVKAPKATKKAGPRRGTKANPVWGKDHPGTKTKACGRDTCEKGDKRQKAAAFHVSYSNKDGLSHWCRECNNAWARDKNAAKKTAAAK